MLRARARCIVNAHAARLISFPGATSASRIQRREMGWSANKKDPSIHQTNGYILTRRQRGETREKTVAYLDSIIAAGFKPNAGTLVSLVHTDQLTLEAFHDLARHLGVDVSKKSANQAWGALFRNYMFDKHGLHKTAMLKHTLHLQDELLAEGYHLPRDVLLSALRQASIAELPYASAILARIFSERGMDDCEPATWWTTLLAAHMQVAFSNDTRAAAVRKVYDALQRRGQGTFEEVLHGGVKAAWLTDNHNDAAIAMKNYFRNHHAARDDFLGAWTILWCTRYRGSYVPTPAVLLEGYPFAQERYGLGRTLIVAAVRGYTAAVLKLRTRPHQDNTYLEQGEIQAVLDGASELTNAVNTLIGDRKDCYPARGTVVRLLAATGDMPGLLEQWKLLCYHSDTPNLDRFILRDVFRACAREKEKALDTVRDILQASRDRWPHSQLDPTTWAEYIACLAEGGALSAAMVCASEQLRREPAAHTALLPVLACAQRLGMLNETKAFLNEKIPEVYRHPRVLHYAALLRKQAKAGGASNKSLESISPPLLPC